MIAILFILGLICAGTHTFQTQPNPYDNPIYFGDEFLNRWDSFRLKFNKSYTTQTEEAVRMMIFRMNCMAIDAHNELGNTGFEMGETFFTDMTPREFSKVLGSTPRLTREADEEDSGEELGRLIDARIDNGENEVDTNSDDGVDYSDDPCIGPVEHQSKFHPR